MKVLVTGATGFVGRFLCSRLLAGGCEVRGTHLASESPSVLVAGVEPVQVEPLGCDTLWSEALLRVDTVVHLAARVHIMDDPTADPLTEFLKVNMDGTLRLAREAVRAGVRRFVFVSSIKVNGEESALPYTEEVPANPSDPYGISKWEAEKGLRQLESETALEVVVVRPTLVYGPGVKANFLKMMTAVWRGIPLPLASISNKRSLVYVENLVDALANCAQSCAAAGETFLISDGDDVSTPQLVRRTASALGVRALLLPFPITLMSLAGRVTGKSAAVVRLTGSLVVDSSNIRTKLGWTPPFSMEDGLRETAEWFKATNVPPQRR